ncbi:S41 family peptidase [Fluviicola sp.]|uniref:S41 family peptidase n=1 Tax=Fluviicola sp. TaxID=1917219 RepID=UPI003D2C55E6
MNTLLNNVLFVLIFFVCTLLNTTSYAQEKREVESISKPEKKELIKSLCEKLDTVYIYPENVSKIRKYFNKKMDQGDYDPFKTPTDFAFQLDLDLQYITNDKHMGIVYDPKSAAEMISQPTASYYTKEVVEELKQTNFGFKEVKILEGNIGYMDLREFCPPKYAAETAIAAINFLSNCNALIIDLRNNGGGDDNMVQLLLSYFLEEDIEFSTSYNRYTDTYYVSQTLPHVPGKKLVDIPLYILTSKATFSGAEAFSYNLKTLKRAVLIGENTGGGENPVEIQVLNVKYIAYISAVRIIKSLSKTAVRWEGIGIEPMIKVNAKDAFFEAQKRALKDLSIKNTSEEQRYQWILDGLEAKQNPFQLKKEILESYVGNYGERKLLLENETLFYQRNGTEKTRLIALDSDTFIIEEIDYLRLKMMKENGKVIGLLRLYNDGSSKQDLKDK